MVIGATDTGKTTLVTALARALASGGFRTAVLDADLGQSEIGPPTTIGLGEVGDDLDQLGQVRVLALHFVGTTSPVGNLLGTLVGTRALLDRARALGFERVVIDTSGLVSGDVGRALKQAKMELLDPGLVVCLERAGECGPIVEGYRGVSRPRILRLPASPLARSRAPEERRQHRQRRLAAYFAGARRRELALDRVGVRVPGGEPLGPEHAGAVAGALAGLLDGRRRTLGLGVVRGVSLERRLLVVDTPVLGDVAAVVIGRESYSADVPAA
jgi:polynucleotide 5'-hydroxyl-kinase GRC3/NOL9